MRAVASIALAAFAIGGCSGTKTYRVPSAAMEPTLHCARPAVGCQARGEDRIRVRLTKNVRRGDIVVFATPRLAAVRCGAGGTYVKRVVALPGESWSERNGRIFINGKLLDEPYIAPARRDNETHSAIPLGKDEYFVLGDNRSASCDSRVWGPVPKRNVIGPVVSIERGSKTIRVR